MSSAKCRSRVSPPLQATAAASSGHHAHAPPARPDRYRRGHRSRRAARAPIAGPAIINQMDTTTLVPPGWQARRIGVRRAGSGTRGRRRGSSHDGCRPSRQDAISVEIFANLFKAVVDEMAWIVLRSSHTTFVKETQDFAVSLVTPRGRDLRLSLRQRRDADHGRADARGHQGVRRLAARRRA